MFGLTIFYFNFAFSQGKESDSERERIKEMVNGKERMPAHCCIKKNKTGLENNDHAQFLPG